MKKWFIVPLFLLLAVVMIFPSCGGQETTGTLRVSMPTFAYESFDAIQGESFFGWSFSDPLLTWDENFEICPSIAESWSTSADGLTWTFKIRQDVKFHNGDQLTAHDVQFSVEHWQSKDSWNPWSNYLSYNFASMSCPDDYTYVYKSVKPELALAIIFTDVHIYPKNYIEKNGIEYFRKNPIGSGPWKFVSFTSGYSCVMEANKEHWRNVPAWDKLIQYVVPEESTQIAMLKRGEVDIITGISLDKVVELRDAGYALQPAAYPQGVVMCMPGTWVTKGPTSDIKVRHALSYAIDYQELCNTFFHGFAEPGGRWFSYPGVWGWDSSWQPEKYDLAKAKALLAEAKYPAAFANPVIDIYVQVGSGYAPDMMQILQGYWADAGIQTEIHMIDPNQWGGMFFVPNAAPDAPNVGAIFPWNFDVSWPNNVYHSFNMYVPGGVHTTSNDAHALELYNKAVRQTDPALMEQYWKEFQTYVHDELFINFGVCLVWNQTVVGPGVGEWGYGRWISLADAYAGIQHK